MGRIKQFSEKECGYVICPLGDQLPLCLYRALKEKKLAKVLPKDLPMCPGLKKCKILSEKEKEIEKRNASYLSLQEMKKK